MPLPTLPGISLVVKMGFPPGSLSKGKPMAESALQAKRLLLSFPQSTAIISIKLIVLCVLVVIDYDILI